jgi:hypothetical protein
MRRLRIILVLTVAGAACSPATNLLPVNDLNRPTDVAFMCFAAFAPTTAPSVGSADGGAADASSPDGAAVDGATAADAGPLGPLRVSGRPMRWCHPPTLYDPPASPTSRTFAFMPDSASGGLTMVDADSWKLIDLDPATGGYGQLPLGELPEQISVSADGCRLISANRGSCDLTLVDPSVVVAPLIDQQYSQDAGIPMARSASETIRPIKGDGTFLTAAPYEAVFLPQDTRGMDHGAYLCGGPGELAQSGPVGWSSPVGTPVPWYALVTYPSCDLMVLIELPSGKIVQSVRAVEVRNPSGDTVEFVDAGKSPVCANSNCVGQSVGPSGSAANGVDAGGTGGSSVGADSGQPGGVDGGAAGNGGGADASVPGPAAFPGIQFADKSYVGSVAGPSSIAIVPDGSQAYVSLSNASYVASFGLSSAGLSLPGKAIELHEGARGSNRIRLNVDPYSYVSGFPIPPASPTDPVFAGKFVGADVQAQYEFLYVIAQDGTLRVVNTFLPGGETECETNADPLNPLNLGIAPTTPCIPVDPARRRPFSIGPGIHFPTLPIDIAAADIRSNPLDHSEQTVNGGHAWVLTASGVVYLVNIDPVSRNFTAIVPSGPGKTSRADYGPDPMTPEAPPFVNTLRDRNEISYSLTLDPSSGPPRVDVLPNVQATGPYIEPFWAVGADNNATALTADYVETGVFFPRMPVNTANFQDPIDRRAITPQTWTVTWEGTLLSPRPTGHVFAEGQTPLPTIGLPPSGPRASVFQDGGANYCTSGVLPGDLVTLTGCTNNAQCGLGEGCLSDATVTTAAGGLPVTGLCVDPNRVDSESATCAAFLTSVRRYQIVSAYSSQLVLEPHLDELVRSSLTPCQPADPDNPADSDCPDPNDPTTNKFTCETVYPGVGTGPRCLMKGCSKDIDCRIGRSCVDFANPTPNCGDGHCFCADAPPLDGVSGQCFDQLVAYQVSAGRSFLVAGTQTGFITTARLPPDGNTPCSLEPTQDPRFSFRIPMDAPLCTNTPAPASDPLLGSPVSEIDSRIDPEVVSTTYIDPATMKPTSFNPQTRATNNANALLQIAETPPTPDPCLYLGGPAGTESLIDPTVIAPPPVPHHVRAVFRNSQISFVLANVDRQPTGQFQTNFDVHGGFVAQVVQDPTTVEVSMPARIVLGPVDSQVQGSLVGPPPTTFDEVPYLFVVDQRRLGRQQGGGPTRGQLLRIHPLGFTSSVGVATGLQPIFQDYTTSGGIFPIQ